ncbi:hypothetical protein [Pelomicrobium methylotrophicum]|uniref:Uncharacterized protein n=1 Tax=Pelomicrobium methylotrophicum TaxID=2602750 RepID=A0A5C7EHK7_9PROT|nr:hypothetical protein [Pelomicrobium methylotrophicum]TXF11541.1 hypothetical protein FR698_09360 [Pelomicrobium methylotrophicum]
MLKSLNLPPGDLFLLDCPDHPPDVPGKVPVSAITQLRLCFFQSEIETFIRGPIEPTIKIFPELLVHGSSVDAPEGTHPPSGEGSPGGVDKTSVSANLHIIYADQDDEMNELKVIEGGRRILEEKLIKLLFTPGPVPSDEVERLNARLSSRANLKIVSDRREPDGPQSPLRGG